MHFSGFSAVVFFCNRVQKVTDPKAVQGYDDAIITADNDGRGIVIAVIIIMILNCNNNIASAGGGNFGNDSLPLMTHAADSAWIAAVASRGRGRLTDYLYRVNCFRR